jgi:mercuric ion binding protein
MTVLRLTPSKLLFYFFLLIAPALTAQEPKQTIAIKSSVVCDMCKRKVQKALAFKGVEKSTVNLETKMITVTYDAQQTTPEKIKSAISKAGYDADEVKADPKAYKKLDKCCKKESEHS